MSKQIDEAVAKLLVETDDDVIKKLGKMSDYYSREFRGVSPSSIEAAIELHDYFKKYGSDALPHPEDFPGANYDLDFISDIVNTIKRERHGL